MGSSGTTRRLALCDWEERDLPVRADFNRDRERIDEAFCGLGEKVASVSGVANGAQEQAGQAQRTMGAHAADAQVHAGAQERAAILAKRFVEGSYTGTGMEQRQVNLGFEPRLAIIWAQGKPPGLVESSGATALFRDVCVPGVECPGSETHANGIVVFHFSFVYNGFIPRLNETGRVYRYVAWA